MSFFRQSAVRGNLVRRARIIDAIRQFFMAQDYLEVETPVRIPTPAPELHIDAQPSGDWFLQTSPELCMKRLLAAGYPRIFQICRCFRRAERGRRHLPELTMLEWYTAGADYTRMMDQCRDLVLFVSGRMGLAGPVAFRGHRIDLHRPWQRLTVAEAFDRFGSISMDAALREGRFDEIMGLEIEPNLGLTRPLFLYDYPAACGALARLKPGCESVAERFELYMGGVELCNGFSELNDAAEQRQRFAAEENERRRLGKTPYPPAERFLDALAQMPEAAGNALGIDRLVMVLLDRPSIDDVVAFTPEEL